MTRQKDGFAKVQLTKQNNSPPAHNCRCDPSKLLCLFPCLWHNAVSSLPTTVVCYLFFLRHIFIQPGHWCNQHHDLLDLVVQGRRVSPFPVLYYRAVEAQESYSLVNVGIDKSSCFFISFSRQGCLQQIHQANAKKIT